MPNNQAATGCTSDGFTDWEIVKPENENQCASYGKERVTVDGNPTIVEPKD